MPDRRAIAVTLAFFIVVSAASGGDREEARVDEVHLKILAREQKIEAAQVGLKDGTQTEGKYVAAERRGLRLTPDRLIPYEEIAYIRLDLGRDRASRIVGGILGGFFIGGILGAGSTYALDDHPAAASAAMLASLGTGGYLGQRFGGIRHKWITIIVRPANP